MKVNSQSLSEIFYTIDTYGTFNAGEYMTDSWFEESEMDNKGFMEDLLGLHVNVIYNAIQHDKNGPILGIEGVSTSSPREYNFQTDQATVELEVDLDHLIKWGRDHDNMIDMFLRDNFTSRDGFWSWTPNNIKDFYDCIAGRSTEYDSEEDKNKCITILAGIYLTQTETLTEEDYMDYMWEGFSEIAWNNFKQFTDETNTEYDKWVEDNKNDGGWPKLDIEEWFKEYKEKDDESTE